MDECKPLLSGEDLLKVKYQGIRPAPGYPTQPDHTEKATMWDLMAVDKEIDVELTESFAMLPSASVSGHYFAGPSAQYFNVGKITTDQVKAGPHQILGARHVIHTQYKTRLLSEMASYDV